MLWVACVSSVDMIYVQEYIDEPNPTTHRTADEKTALHPPPHPRSLGHSAFHLAVLPTIESAPSLRCHTNGFAMLPQRVLVLIVLEPCRRGSRGHCMIPVTRYLLVSRVPMETKNDLKSSLLGSDKPSGLYNSVKR